MDFARINPRRDAEVGADYHVEYLGERLYADGEPITLKVLGLESETGRRATAHMVKKARGSSKKGGKDVADMSVDEILKTASENEGRQAEFYSQLIVGWENVFYIDDDKIDDPEAEPYKLEFSKENAKKLLTTRPWILEGLDAFLGDKRNFIRKVVDG